MYQEDYLLRQIRELVRALSDLQDDDHAAAGQLDAALQRTLGLSIELLDRLPSASIVTMVRRGDTNDPRRLCLVADALEALASPPGPVAHARRKKARAIREAALG